jgi:pyrroline-5-carboxylate reductase
LGKVLWVEDEELLDPVTAVSGSGPAYVFLLVECLAEAGQAAGLDAELSEELARATVMGSAALLEQTDHDVSKLRELVTSPGGTTAAALAILNGPEGLRPLLKAAVAAATKRGRELSKCRRGRVVANLSERITPRRAEVLMRIGLWNAN